MAYALDPTRSIFFINVARGGMQFLQYRILEGLKDRMVFSEKYESVMKILLKPTHVIVFSNEMPDRTKMSEDRYVERFNLTLTQSEEYVANLGAAIWPSGGNAVLDGGKGGGGSFFYKGGELLVASGGGGGGSNGPLNAGGRDGSGGGIGVNPTLPTVGFFPGGS